MNIFKNILVVIIFFLFVSCHKNTEQTELQVTIDSLNKEAFDLRYKNMGESKVKSEQALLLIDNNIPDYYNAKAQAWNNIAYSYYLRSYFDSTRIYLNKVRNIEAKYDNKEIEEAITYITEARLFLRECKYAEAFTIYDSTLTIFKGNVKYNNYIPLKKYDHVRYSWAKSDYLIGNAVLGYYYRNTELPIILKSLDEIKDHKQLNIDTTQLSVLYYTYAGSHQKAIIEDVRNFYIALDYVKKGLDVLHNPITRNDYNLANFYQITGIILLNNETKHWLAGKDSTQINSYVNDFKQEYLVKRYGWDTIEVESESLPLLLVEKADSIFRKYDDPYQNMASNIYFGNHYIEQKDTILAWSYYDKAVECDSIIAARKGFARVWTKQLYHTLLTHISDKNSIQQVKNWYDIYSRESEIIAEHTKEDYSAQRDRIEAEAQVKRSLFLVFLIMSICAIVLVLLYFLNKQNNKLKRARSGLRLRNEELEENRTDLELLAKIGKHIVSTFEIDDDSKKVDFIDGIYKQIRELKVLSDLPDFSFILYIKNNNNELQRYCKESLDTKVDISFHSMNDLQRPAVGCFLKNGREVMCFNDWNTEFKLYAKTVGIDSKLINPEIFISGNSTRSLAFINLYSKKGDKIGVLSFQTTELNAFKKPLLLASFEIIAEYVAAALDNAMQYEELHFVQKKLIEQKRMELLTYVVRGISHELSQPLGSITQTLYDTFKDVDTLKEDKENLSDDEYQTIVNNINSDLVTISQSKGAISDLINSFKNTIKENIIDPQTDFNLSSKLDDIVKVIKPNIKSNINLIVDCPPDLTIRSFSLLFSQIITNLISNANQHAFPDSDDPKNTVHIICKESGKDLVVECIDNGIGIPENELDKLCQPFVSKKQTNLGLGLSLVKNIVEQYMRGEVRFSSDKGLTVTVVIPDCIIK